MTELLTIQDRRAAFELLQEALSQTLCGNGVVVPRDSERERVAFALQARGILAFKPGWNDGDFERASHCFVATKRGQVGTYSLLWFDSPDTSNTPLDVEYICPVKECKVGFPTWKELYTHFGKMSFDDKSWEFKDNEHGVLRKRWDRVMKAYQFGTHPLSNENNDHFGQYGEHVPYSQYRRYNRIGFPICQWCSMGIHSHGISQGGNHDCKVLLIEGGQCNCYWGAKRE